MTVRHNKTYGFTVIELLIVVVVISILATLSIIVYGGIQANARDKSVLADLDTVDGLQTQYGTSNSVAGKAWYSGNGVDSSLQFTPSPGDVIDVVINSTDYCIRGYNTQSSTYKSLLTAAKKESTAGICSTLSASATAWSNSPIVNTGVVTTLAGSGATGYVDATGTSAQISNVYALATDSSGNLFIPDSTNKRIRKITPAGVVTTFAGSGVSGSADGTGTGAQFAAPSAITIDQSTNTLYVTDVAKVRKITSGAVVTTLVPTGTFNSPNGITVDASGTLFVADTYNHRISKVTSAGVVTTLAGSGVAGFADNTGTSAQFNYPYGIAIDPSGNIYVSDRFNHRIRKVTSAGVVTTLAGSGTLGYIDATGTGARFNYPYGIAFDPTGIIYVSDDGNYRIRKIQ
jgi:prepilin-type N-terminal cleavage/methylation domain-containing protein